MNKAKNEPRLRRGHRGAPVDARLGKVPNTDFDAGLGLVPGEVIEFLKVSQPDEWDALVTRVGGGSEVKTAEKVVGYIAGEIDRRGTVHMLRNRRR